LNQIEGPSINGYDDSGDVDTVGKVIKGTPLSPTDNHTLMSDRRLTKTVDELISDFEIAVYDGDETALLKAIESMDSCRGCVERLADLVLDSAYDDILRLNSAKALIKMGFYDGITAVVRAIVDAHNSEEYDFSDSLMQVLAGINTVEGAETIISTLLETNSSYLDFAEIPDDIRNLLQKIVRLSPNQEVVADSLIDQYESGSETQREHISEINQSVMKARLASQAYSDGDINLFDQYIDDLIRADNSASLESLMGLVSHDVDVQDVANAAFLWLEQNPENQYRDILFNNLTELSSSSEERAIAAYALAAMGDNAEVIQVLEKAYNHQEDPLVIGFIQSALTLIEGNTSKSPSSG